MNKLDKFNQNVKSENSIPELKTGQTVKVYQKIKEGDKERIQVFEGLIISKKGEKGLNVNITVRKVNYGVGVERIFPIYSPNVSKIEVVKNLKVRRAKLYYMRDLKGKRTRLAELAPKKTAIAEFETNQPTKTKVAEPGKKEATEIIKE